MAPEIAPKITPERGLQTLDGTRPQAQAAESALSHRSLRLEPRRGLQTLQFKELWLYRELLWFMAVRDVMVRYKQTLLGAGWAIVQPVMQMLVFTVFFGKMANLQAQTTIPYAVLTFTALLPWQLFSSAMTQAGNSLVANSNLISKVYFPRMIVPLSSVLATLMDFFVAFLVLAGLMAWYGIVPGWQVVFLPLFIALAMLASLAVGVGLAALNVEFRDVRYTLPFLVQIWMFATPVAYPSEVYHKLPEPWLTIYGLNPMVGVVEGFRWALLGQQIPSLGVMVASVVATVVILVISVLYFVRVERTFADRV